MSMSVAGDKQGVMCEINTTPLIDVMLVLIVTLIMTLPIQTHAVKLDMPPPTDQPPPAGSARGDQSRHRFRRHRSYWDGNTVDLDQLEGYFRVESKKDPQPEIHLRPDKRSHYDTTAKVLAVGAAQWHDEDRLCKHDRVFGIAVRGLSSVAIDGRREPSGAGHPVKLSELNNTQIQILTRGLA